MPIALDARLDMTQIRALQRGPFSRALNRAARKASSTALRDMKAEANKRVRARKELKKKIIQRALVLQRARSRDIDDMEWGIHVRRNVVRVADYPHRQTRKGVTARINKGQRTLIRGAFKATMKSGHEGVFRRRGVGRLPIDELVASRPVDALLHDGEAEGVLIRGRNGFDKALERLLLLEMEKERGQ